MLSVTKAPGFDRDLEGATLKFVVFTSESRPGLDNSKIQECQVLR